VVACCEDDANGGRFFHLELIFVGREPEPLVERNSGVRLVPRISSSILVRSHSSPERKRSMIERFLDIDPPSLQRRSGRRAGTMLNRRRVPIR
jgi:hypothetical protein